MMGHGDFGWDWRSFAWLNSFIPLRPVASVASLHQRGGGKVPLCQRVQRLCKSQDALESWAQTFSYPAQET